MEIKKQNHSYNWNIFDCTGRDGKAVTIVLDELTQPNKTININVDIKLCMF